MTNEVPEFSGRLSHQVEDWFDNIDAAVFSGDTFLDNDNRARARWYAQRWLRIFDERDQWSEEEQNA